MTIQPLIIIQHLQSYKFCFKMAKKVLSVHMYVLVREQ
jgi:hypothetical protein